MAPVYSTVATYAFLGCAAGHCLSQIGNQISFAMASYGSILLHSIVGVIRYWEHEDSGESIERAYRSTLQILSFLALPGIVATLWLKYEPRVEVAYIHFGVSCLPFALYILDKPDEKFADTVLMINFISCLYITIINKNWPGVGTAVCAALVTNFDRSGDEVAGLKNVDVCNIAGIAYCIASLHALSTAGGVKVA